MKVLAAYALHVKLFDLVEGARGEFIERLFKSFEGVNVQGGEVLGCMLILDVSVPVRFRVFEDLPVVVWLFNSFIDGGLTRFVVRERVTFFGLETIIAGDDGGVGGWLIVIGHVRRLGSTVSRLLTAVRVSWSSSALDAG